MRQTKQIASKMAQTESAILLTGESGTGKELFAHSIHHASPRRKMPFVAVNCAALSETLLESELFGYDEGAFTGAKKGGKLGLFEYAHMGTLFLDEIEGMSQHLQVKLLRVLQEKEFMRVGGNRIIPTDVRIIAASNEDILERVRQGSFRKDLYYRLNTLPIQLPPLRERGEDLFLIADHLIQRTGASFVFAPETCEILRRYHWDGNVRELTNLIEYLTMLGKELVQIEDLPSYIRDEVAERDIVGETSPEHRTLQQIARGREERFRFVLSALGKAQRGMGRGALMQEAELHYGTNDVIPLWIADMDFRTAPCIVKAIKDRADQGIFGYTWRTPKYFETIAAWQRARNGWDAPIEKMAFAPGVVPGMRMMMTMFTNPGDKVLIQQPVYHPFADVVNNTGRELVVNCLKRDEDGYYTMDLHDFEEKLKTGVKVFILCNPHNPVGRCWTREELKAVGDLCVRYGVEIISDEIHSDLMLDGHKHTCMAALSPEIAAITTTCIAPSKTFNLAGLQSSTIVFNTVEKMEAYVAELKRMDIARNNCFSLLTTIAAYEEGGEWLEQLLVYLSGNMKFIRDFCAERLPELKPNTPEATYLCWIDARGLGMSNDELQKFCVEKAGVAFGNGAEFGAGGDGFLRLNAACPRAVIEKALTQLETAVRTR